MSNGFDYGETSKEYAKKFKKKKKLEKILKSHSGPDNKVNGNGVNGTSRDILESLSGASSLSLAIPVGPASQTGKISSLVAAKFKKDLKELEYPGGLGPDAHEGSPDTGEWDEDQN